MSKMIHIEKEGYIFLFSCSSRSTRSGFAHDCTMFQNYNVIAKASCHYLNRTWECYTYQTVAMHALGNEIEFRQNYLKQIFMSKNNIKRLTEKRRAELQQVFDNDKYLSILQSVNVDLKNNLY